MKKNILTIKSKVKTETIQTDNFNNKELIKIDIKIEKKPIETTNINWYKFLEIRLKFGSKLYLLLINKNIKELTIKPEIKVELTIPIKPKFIPKMYASMRFNNPSNRLEIASSFAIRFEERNAL